MYSSHTPPRFPPISEAGPDGLLMLGGSLAPDWMLAGYRQGIFPMPLEVERKRVLAWFSPQPRGILELTQLHVSRRLARRLRRGEFRFTINQAFAKVVEACAEPRSRDTGCWLTLALQNAYLSLHQLGYAHSLEVWREKQLVGGIFGIAIGGFFAGESMFHRATDASKGALVRLVQHLRKRDFRLLDVQWTNSHTRSLGATEIDRQEYLARLEAAIQVPTSFNQQLT